MVSDVDGMIALCSRNRDFLPRMACSDLTAAHDAFRF